MAIACVNPTCAHVFVDRDWTAGDRMRCPACGTEFSAPGPPSMELTAAVTATPGAHSMPIPAAQPVFDGATSRSATPGADIPDLAMPDLARRWFILKGRERVGPLGKDQLLAAGLEHFTLVWHPGAERWRPARDIPDLAEVLHWVPPPAPGGSLWGSYARALPGPATFHTLYFWALSMAIVGGVMLALMTAFLIVDAESRGRAGRSLIPEALAVVSLTLGIATIVASLALQLVLLYQMWKVIQDGYTPFTPLAAVFLLFVPVFNLFWVFVAIFGLARELQRFTERHGIAARPPPVGLSLATCICLVVPMVNPFVALPLLLVTIGLLKGTAADIAASRLSDGVAPE